MDSSARHGASALHGRMVVAARALLLLALGLSAVPANADGAQTSAAAQTARAILAREHCQTEMPAPEGSQSPGLTASRISGPDSEPVELPVLPALGGLLPALTIIAVVVGLAVALALVLRHVAPDAETGRLGRPATGAAPQAPREQPLPDPERLAQAGRFADAIHALLLRALRHLGRCRAAGVTATSLTSREILGSTALTGDARQALAPLVAAVERVYFGRSGGAGVDDYAACVGHCRRFEATCRTDR
jgi:hypothetical protein